MTTDPSAAGCTDPCIACMTDESHDPAPSPAPQPAVPSAGRDLRDRIAAALLARIKLATVSKAQPFDAVTSLLAPNEFDLADAVLAVLPAHADQAALLLRDAESYLSALHGSVARHDNLAANLGCAGCELRDQIGTELRRIADEAQQAEPKAAPAVAYSGKGRVFCVTCPHPADENVPLTPEDVQPHECCAVCDRELIEVAYEAQQDGKP